jgi:hypothetical protein
MTHVRIAKHALQKAAAIRPVGYMDDVLSAASRSDDLFVYMDRGSYKRLSERYRESGPVPAKGCGTELKLLLSRVGITASSGCSCNSRANYMDQMGEDWCSDHIDEIVGWLREEAHKRGLPFFDAVGRLLVRAAIANSRRNS